MKAGWVEKKLGEVCEFDGGSQPPKSNFIYEPKDGYVRFLQIRDFGTEKHATFIPDSKKNRRCNADDILIGRYGASVGKILTGKEGAYNVALMKTEPDLRLLNKGWFHNYLLSNHFQESLMKVADRSAQNGFSKDDIYNFPVPIPPLSEQAHIVGILDEAFASIATAKANTQKNLENAKAVFESHLNSVFSKVDCPEVEIRSIGEVYDGPHATPKTVDFGPIFLGISSLDNGSIDLSETRHVTEEDFVKWTRRVEPKAKDIVFSYETRLGQVAIVPENLRCCLGRRMGLVRLRLDRIHPKFFVYQYISPKFKTYLDGKTVRGATVDRIALKDFPNFKIGLPPMSRQLEITNEIDQLREDSFRLTSLYTQKLSALEDLKKSLLHQAFTGKL
jgi:type I restriction enzyme S subunit